MMIIKANGLIVIVSMKISKIIFINSKLWCKIVTKGTKNIIRVLSLWVNARRMIHPVMNPIKFILKVRNYKLLLMTINRSITKTISYNPKARDLQLRTAKCNMRNILDRKALFTRRILFTITIYKAMIQS